MSEMVYKGFERLTEFAEGGTMTDGSEVNPKQQAKSWKAIQIQVQALAKKAQQARFDSGRKSQ